MDQNIRFLRDNFSKELQAAKTCQDLENMRVRYLGKKGPVQELMKELKSATPEMRRDLGKEINDLKEELTKSLEDAAKTVADQELEVQLAAEVLDVSLPGRRYFAGRKHPVTETMDEILEILMEMGFSAQVGPDIDTDYYNFEALNFSADHPARDMQDTFYISPNVLLRTHTSNIQARVMEQHKPPIRIITPGKAYRNETITARSHVFFHQVEGLYIDKGVTFGDLLATLKELFCKLFHAEIQLRCRPSYFPFVEPGMEVDISCLNCEGHGCQLCKHSGWLEVAGAGLVHPEVLKNGDIDPEVYSGYAWGMGVERILMLKRGIKDIRLLTENDMRFLRQFSDV
ncbi:MAG: phenylalanine--tRNA ligase subunit alpha [Parachlamydiaceae bacterium]|nr:phenylalanine--tRNA ligase subunit alpha [Parachlamydiaceae bacterium]